MNMISEAFLTKIHLQVALVIRSFAILGFDYLQARKQLKTVNN